MILKYSLTLVVVVQLASAYNVADDVVGAQNFALGLFKSQFDNTKNTVYSPFSIRVLLSILYQSATGSTEHEIRDRVFFGEKSSTLNTQSEMYQSFWTNPSITLANKIYLAKGGSLDSDFEDVVRSFNSEIEQVNFKRKSLVVAQMNQFVEEKTNGLIKKLISTESITPDTALFLLNTLYFKAKWESQFSANHVDMMDFTNFRGLTRQIQFMHQFGQYRYANLTSIGAEIIEMPYENHTNMEFLVVLPHPESNIASVLEKFGPGTFNEFVEKSSVSKMFYYMPIFETESSLDVKAALRTFGMSSMFDRNELNMCEDRLPQRVDEAKQKTKIIVNTEGTEATSATFLKVVPYTDWPDIRVERPFFYMVVTRDNKIPLFVGHFSE